MEKIRCNPPIIKVLTTIFQNAPNNRKGLPSGVLSRFDLGSIDWNGNRGEVVAALLTYSGLQWSASERNCYAAAALGQTVFRSRMSLLLRGLQRCDLPRQLPIRWASQLLAHRPPCRSPTTGRARR